VIHWSKACACKEPRERQGGGDVARLEEVGRTFIHSRIASSKSRPFDNDDRTWKKKNEKGYRDSPMFYVKNSKPGKESLLQQMAVEKLDVTISSNTPR
jgi:hypothetical protein